MTEDSLEQCHPDEAAIFRWKRSEGQNSWIKIGVAFLLFYFGEAVLFWGGDSALAAPLTRLPLAYPFVYPLGYWGMFGASIFFILRRSSSSTEHNAVAKRFFRWQGALLTLGITVGVVGVAFVVMRGSGNTTLGHVALFFAMFLAAAVIGAMELNVGWLAAALLWLFTAIVLNVYPATMSVIPRFKDEDVWIGIATALGFVLIGALPQCVDRRQLDT